MVICNCSSDTCMLKPLLERRLTNLDHHAKLIKAKYFPDWDSMWVEGEYQYPSISMASNSSLLSAHKINPKDEHVGDEDTDKIMGDGDDSKNNPDIPEASCKESVKPKVIEVQNKPLTAKKATLINGKTAENSHVMANNKFLKQIATAEKNVKKLLRSPPPSRHAKTQVAPQQSGPKR